MIGLLGLGGYGLLDGYGTISLTVSSPPQSFAEPLSLDEVKTSLKLPLRSPPDDGEDNELSALISAARIQAEIMQGRDLIRKQWDLSLDYWMHYFIRLSRSPLVSVDLFQIKDSTGALKVLAEGVDYIVDMAKSPGLIVPPYNAQWPNFTPWPSSAILIRYTSGMDPDSAWWAADGVLVKFGMLRLIADWFSNKLPVNANVTEYSFGTTAMLSQGALKLVG